MPAPKMCWRLVTISTKGSWLPGDPRGWRSRGHKRHSSGNYRRRPPAGEHEGLHEHVKRDADKAVVIPTDARGVAGQALVARLQQENLRVLAVSVCGMHAHILVELPLNPAEARLLVGYAKRFSSLRVGKWLPGTVWSEGGSYEVVKNRDHQLAAYQYVLEKQGPGAWTWSFKDDERRGNEEPGVSQ